MIVVDTSAWVELIRATGSTVHQRLESAIAAREPLAVTELVVAELLAGARTPKHRSQVRNMALSLPVLRLRGLAAYEAAAALYRACRERGETLRGITDCLVAVPAIEARAPVLHLDRDFEILARHTPLEVALLDD